MLAWVLCVFRNCGSEAWLACWFTVFFNHIEFSYLCYICSLRRRLPNAGQLWKRAAERQWQLLRSRPCLVAHLLRTPAGHTGRVSACVLGCSGGSGLPRYTRGSLQDRPRSGSSQSGRTPPDTHSDTGPDTGIWPCRTDLHGERKRPERQSWRTELGRTH